MGEKRFVAIVEVEEQRFLVGGGSAGVSLLARLDLAGGPDPAAERECAATPDFAAVLERQQVDPASSAARVASGMGEAW
jgi:flagellar biogenesis protein FliO